MTIQRAYKTKLVLNNHERGYFNGCAGFSRFVYNWGLAEAKRQYEETGKTPSPRNALKKQFNAIKRDEFPWTAEYPYVILQEAFDDLDRAFKNFFRRVKEGAAEPGYPRFKRRGHHDSFRLISSIAVESARIKLPRIGWIRLAEPGYLPVGATVNSATVSRTADDWYISIQVEEPDPEPLQTTGATLGVALGIRTPVVAVTAGSEPDGLDAALTFNFTRPHAADLKKLARLNRELSRRAKGGANWRKTAAKLARLHADIANARRHEQHNISAALTRGERPSRIILPDIDWRKAMQTGRKEINRKTADTGLGELTRQIEYKGLWTGIEVIKADKFTPFASTCSVCGIFNDSEPGERLYRCRSCGLVIEREVNAASNLAALPEPVKHGGLPVELDELSSTVKQEAGAGGHASG